MAIFNMGGGGGSTIPFEVIVSERKPTTIRKDTIWVNPDLTKISPYEKINLNIPIEGPLTAQKDATTTKYCTIFEEEPIIYLDSVKRYFYKYTLNGTANKYNCFAISNNVSKFRWGFTSAATAETASVLDSGIVNITTEYEHFIQDFDLSNKNQTVKRNGTTEDGYFYFSIKTQNAPNKNFFIELLEYSDTPIVYAKTTLGTALPAKYTIGKNQTLTATSTPVNYIVKQNILKASDVSSSKIKSDTVINKYFPIDCNRKIYKIYTHNISLDYGKFFVFNSKSSDGNLLNPGDYLASADILEGKVFYTTMSGFRPYTIPSGKPNRFNQIFQQSLTEEYFIFSTEGYRSYYDETFPVTGTAYIGFECLNGDKELIIEDITDTFYVRGDITDLNNQNYQYAHNNIQERYNNTYTISNTIFDEIDIDNSFDTKASSKLFLWIRNNNLENKQIQTLKTVNRNIFNLVDAVIAPLRYKGDAATEDTDIDQSDFKLYFLEAELMYLENNQIVSIPLRTYSGASFNFKDFVEGRVDYLEDPNVSSIRKYAFYDYTNLRTISFPNCNLINQDAFTNCINLSTLYLPKWPSPESQPLDFRGSTTTDNISPFNGCNNIEKATVGFTQFSNNDNAVLKNAKNVGSPFNDAINKLRFLIAPNCTQIGNYVFQNYTNLEQVEFKEDGVSIGTAAFKGCVNLKKVIGDITGIGQNGFNGDTLLQELSLSNCKYILVDAFDGCINLNKIDAPQCECFGGTDSTKKTFIGVEDNSPFTYVKNIVPLQELRLSPLCASTTAQTLFSNFSNTLTRVEAPGITFGEKAFQNAQNLEYVHLSPNQTTIPNSAFQNCGKYIQDYYPDTNSNQKYEFNYNKTLDELTGQEIIISIEEDDTLCASIQYEDDNCIQYFLNEDNKIEILESTYYYQFKFQDKDNNDLTSIDNLDNNLKIVANITGDPDSKENPFNTTISNIVVALYNNNSWTYPSKYFKNTKNLWEEISITLTDEQTTNEESIIIRLPKINIASFNLNQQYLAKNTSINGYPKFNSETKTIDYLIIETPRGISNLNYNAALSGRYSDNLGISAPNVYAIGNYGFANCYNLSYVSLIGSHATVANNSLGSYAFQNCHNLTDIFAPNIYTFKNANKYIPYNCGDNIISPFKKVNFANLVSDWTGAKISTHTSLATLFPNCRTLEYVILNNFSKFNDLTNPTDNIYVNLQGGAFKNCSTIGSYCFANTQIQSIEDSSEIPTNLWGNEEENLSCLNIGYSPDITELTLNIGAFQNCNKLTNINLNKVVKIPNYCFDGCISLTNLEIPAVEISEGSFQNCSKLNSVKINNATTIGKQAFKQCDINELKMDKIQQINDNAFYKAINYDEQNKVVINLPSSLTSIGNAVFTFNLPNEDITINQKIKFNLNFNDNSYYPLGTEALGLKENIELHFTNEYQCRAFIDTFDGGDLANALYSWKDYFDVDPNTKKIITNDITKNTHITYSSGTNDENHLWDLQ